MSCEQDFQRILVAGQVPWCKVGMRSDAQQIMDLDAASGDGPPLKPLPAALADIRAALVAARHSHHLFARLREHCLACLGIDNRARKV